jgi:hypothetical protein
MNSFFTPQLAQEQALCIHTFRHLELYSSTGIKIRGDLRGGINEVEKEGKQNCI